MGRGGQGFQGRGMMGRGGQEGFEPRGMGRPGSGIPPTPDVRPFPQKSPEEDVLRPAPPMRGRGMGRGFPGPRGPETKPENN